MAEDDLIRLIGVGSNEEELKKDFDEIYQGRCCELGRDIGEPVKMEYILTISGYKQKSSESFDDALEKIKTKFDYLDIPKLSKYYMIFKYYEKP